jgi:hypothetical protein
VTNLVKSVFLCFLRCRRNYAIFRTQFLNSTKLVLASAFFGVSEISETSD